MNRKSTVKEIEFDNRKAGNDHFDLVDMNAILTGTPKDHSQFDHHKVAFYVILLITQGKGRHSINYQDYTFEEGTVFTLRKNNIHKFYKTKAEGRLLVFTEDFAVRFADKEESLKLFQLFNEMLTSPKIQLNRREFEEVSQVIRQISREYFDVNDNHSHGIIRSLTQALILRLYRLKLKENKNLDDKTYPIKFLSFQELVEKDCFQSKKVSYYAHKMGVTNRTLNNITQKVVGKSAKSFIDEVTILQIKRLLINSQLSFKEIAYQSGFGDPTNFFKFFKKRTGLSPKQFREQHL